MKKHELRRKNGPISPKKKIKTALVFLIVNSILFFCATGAFSEILLEDDFETDDDLAKWMHPFDADGDIQYNSFAHTGDQSARIYYYVPAGEPEHRSTDRALNAYFAESEGIETINVRGYFYIPFVNHPHDGSSRTYRKLFYIKGHDWVSWSQTVSVTDDDWGETPSMGLTAGGAENVIGLAKVTYDEWHCLELHLDLNTPGSADGTVRIWLDGDMVYENTSAETRESDEDVPLKNVQIGEQVDKNGDTESREEYRYWDDIVITDGTYIGPVQDNQTSQLAPPLNMSIGSIQN